MTLYREWICEYELKHISIYFGIVYFCQIQLAGLIEKHCDLDPTMDQQVLKRAYLHKSCLNIHNVNLKWTALKHFVVAVA